MSIIRPLSLKVIGGFHNVLSIVQCKPHTIDKIYIVDKHKLANHKKHLVILQAINQINNNNQLALTIEYLDAHQFEKLAKIDYHQGFIVKIKPSFDPLDIFMSYAEYRKNYHHTSCFFNIILALDGIMDVNNLGAIIRSAEYFGVNAIVIPRHHSAQINEAVARVSVGSVYRIPIISPANLHNALEELKDMDYWIYGTSLDRSAISLFELKQIDLPSKIVIVMGSEDNGMRHLTQKTCDVLLNIPRYGNTQSLNVSCATATVLSYIRHCNK